MIFRVFLECSDVSLLFLINAQTSLMQQLAIPLSNPTTIAKWLVMRTPNKQQRRAAALQKIPSGG